LSDLPKKGRTFLKVRSLHNSASFLQKILFLYNDTQFFYSSVAAGIFEKRQYYQSFKEVIMCGRIF
jgi:hypothetical protein